MKQSLIVGGGPVALEQLQSLVAAKPDLIVAVDRGALYLAQLGIKPQMLLGDFDSLPEDQLQALIAAGVPYKSFSPQKDQTDLELALDFALEQGAGLINILGGLGKRLDHTLGNIGLLFKPLEMGVEAHLLDVDHDLFLINSYSQIVLEDRDGWAVSLIPLTLQVSGINTTGLVYPLKDETLFMGSCRGIHNRFDASTAYVRITQGILLIVRFRED